MPMNCHLIIVWNLIVFGFVALRCCFSMSIIFCSLVSHSFNIFYCCVYQLWLYLF